MTLRALAEINLAAIERNAGRLRALLRPETRLCAVVKADGYGHGSAQAARAALAGGATTLAVATAAEADELRRDGLSVPILVLGAISEQELAPAVAAGAELCAWDERFVTLIGRHAQRAGLQIPVHVKLDTGLGRLGTRVPEHALTVAEQVRQTSGLSLSGVMTHFATADGDAEYVAHQLRVFEPFVARIRESPGGRSVTVHAANSAGILRFPEAHFDMVRAGIALYGADPMNQDPAAHGLEPALALRSYVAAVKRMHPGESAGYGRRFVSERETCLATLPIGYADGVPRGLTNNCEVLIGGRRYPLVGTVSMDNITVDVGPEHSVQVGERGTLIGPDGAQRQTVEELAGRLGTINYEVMCWISKRVPRRYHRDGESE